MRRCIGGIERQCYHDWRGRAPSERTAVNVTLLAHIEAAHVKRDATYGMACIRAGLADQNVRSSRKRIASVMRLASTQLGQTPVCRHGCQPTLDGRHDLRANLDKLFSLGSSSGCLQPQSGGLGIWGQYDG